MNRLCVAQNSAKSTVKKLPGEVEFPNNSLVAPFLQEPPMGLRSHWHEKAAHRFQFQGALFITRSPGGSARSDPTLVLLPFCNTQKIAHNSTTSQTKSCTIFSSVCVCERVRECGRGVLLSWYVWASGNFRICPLHTPSLRTNARGKGLGNSIRNLSSMRQIQPP
jgi:hypothetical protein